MSRSLLSNGFRYPFGSPKLPKYKRSIKGRPANTLITNFFPERVVDVVANFKGHGNSGDPRSRRPKRSPKHQNSNIEYCSYPRGRGPACHTHARVAHRARSEKGSASRFALPPCLGKA